VCDSRGHLLRRLVAFCSIRHLSFLSRECSLLCGCHSAASSPLHYFNPNSSATVAAASASANIMPASGFHGERFCMCYAFSLSFRYIALNNKLFL